MLPPLLTWLVPDPNAPKWAFEPRQFGYYVFSGFSEDLSIFKNPFLGEIQARHQKTQNEEGRANTNIFCHFSRSLVLGLSIEIFRPATWKTHFPRSSGHVRPRRISANLILAWSQGAGPQVTVRNFSWKMPHFQHVAPGRRCIFAGTVALTVALTKPTRHYKNRDFPPSDAAHPIFERITGSILERIGEKKSPHYRTQQHICICWSLTTIYILVWSIFIKHVWTMGCPLSGYWVVHLSCSSMAPEGGFPTNQKVDNPYCHIQQTDVQTISLSNSISEALLYPAGPRWTTH